MTYSWRFTKMRPVDKVREAIQGEFFSTDAISNPGEALIREGIQNSLDAHIDGGRVEVRIRVSSPGSTLKKDKIAPFMHGLEEHIKGAGLDLKEISEADVHCPFLVFEDFGTTGLIGDTNEFDPPENSCNRFFHFFRAEGLSDKGEKDRGRWGLGKYVFTRASSIKTIFGLTIRNDDKKEMLMGMAVLKTHKVKDIRYFPDGLLGCNSDAGDDQLILPIEDPLFIDKFCKTFNVSRGKHPGTTIVIPWSDLDLTDENLISAVLRDYFWPILYRQLEVLIETNTLETIIDADTLEKELKKTRNGLEEEILPFINLTKWSMEILDTDFIKLNKPDSSRALQWSKELIPKEYLKDLQDRYERGEKLAFRVPVTIREKNKKPCDSYFDVFMHRDNNDKSGRPIFVRQGIIIPDIRAPRTHGVRSIVHAEDGPIAAFLGDAENPAHTQWQKGGDKFKNKYISGPADLQFVIRSVQEIINIICEQDTKIDRALLVDLFSIPVLPDAPEYHTPEKKEKEKPGDDVELPKTVKSKPRAFVIDQIKNGFVVRNTDSKKMLLPKNFLITAAYNVRGGNPFKAYNDADFDFATGMEIQVKGATIENKTENRIFVNIDNNEFRIEVTGFDINRDVIVDVKIQEE